MKRILVIVAILAALAMMAVESDAASAAQPIQKGCVGTDVSRYSSTVPRFGQFIAAVATTTGGMADEVHALQAGYDLDAIFCVGSGPI